MNFSTLFIQRPVATVLLALGIAFAGLVAFYGLPVAPLPQVEFPTISVQAALPGASPSTMASTVATPLERKLGTIAGVTEMTSSSTLGSTRVTLQFDLSRNIDGAARDVQAAINAARADLPANLPINPIYRKVNPADAPIMIISLTSENYPIAQIYDMASTILQQKLSQLDGIGQVVVSGGALPAVRVELNPLALSQYGIGLETVQSAIKTANTNRPKGQWEQSAERHIIYSNDQLYRAEQYRPLIIAYRNQQPVRLSDVATVIDSVEDVRNMGLANGKRGVALILFKQPGANVIQTVDNVKAVLPILKASIPAAITMNVMMDRTTTIRASLHDVERTLVIAIGLVILVTYFFLRDIRALWVAAVAIPLSLLGTFAVMQLLHFSLDNLSLMALTISTGFVIDDAVVMLENVVRHIEAGEKPMKAALNGAKEVGFTVIAMSISLIAVFIPILLMGGIVGRLFREFAITLAIAILISLFVSLTIIPMMCARLLKENKQTQKKAMSIFSRMGHWIYQGYEKTLRWALEHARFMLFLTVLTVVLNIGLFVIVPKGFFPQQDTGRMTGAIVGDQNISFQAMQGKLRALMAIVKADPAVLNVAGVVGGNGATAGAMYITLKSLAQRKLSADAVIGRLRKKCARVTGVTLYLQAAQDLVIGGRQGNAQFQYTLSADHLSTLQTWVPRVLTALRKIPGIADVNSDQRDRGLQVLITIDRQTAARLGVSVGEIDRALYAAFGQSQISTIYTPMNQYHVVMEVAPTYWQHPDTLRDLDVVTTTGEKVPLSSVAHFATSGTLLSVNHQEQKPAATLSFNLLPDVAIGDAVKRVEETMRQLSLPYDMTGAFKGVAAAFQSSLSNEPYLILAALLAVYIVLGMLYESVIHPITILSTLPSAGIGALLALQLTKIDFSIIALIGVILLIGIVKKNAIMMIDFALQARRQEKKSAQAAIYEAALLRFRPIMMTTMAALLGAVPLAFDWGVGAELRRPLGISIIGGLIVSQVLTLYTTPVVYLFFESLYHHIRGTRTAQDVQ